MAGRRDRIRMTHDEGVAFLNGRHTLNLASFGPDGNIHLVAMWYGFLDGSGVYDARVDFGSGDIVIETFAKSQKVQNLRRDPRFTAIVETGEQYDQLQGMEMVGRAEVIDDVPVVIESCKAVLSRYQPLDDPDDLQFAAEFAARKRVCVRLRVDKVVSWDHRKLDVPY
ncbi:MAG: pyridoxamine 5'-phosphate oxidase family protein [Microthrixaceae bacterium]